MSFVKMGASGFSVLWCRPCFRSVSVRNGFGDYWGLRFLSCFALGFRFWPKLGFRICNLMWFVFSPVSLRKINYTPQRSAFVWFCLGFSVLIEIRFGFAVFYYYLYGMYTSNKERNMWRIIWTSETGLNENARHAKKGAN